MKITIPASFELKSGPGEASGCINGVLQWILCRNLKERRFIDEKKDFGIVKEEFGKTTASSSPGIVARLMGLESLPVFAYAEPEKISRTRSANSAESGKKPGLFGEPRTGDTGSELRKSQSFREVRSFLRKESEEFLVLSFGEEDEDEDEKKKDFSFDLSGLKESKKKKIRNKILLNSSEIKLSDPKCSVSQIGKQFSCSEKGMILNENMEKSCRKKISFSQGEMEIEFSSQNSSPVSVLDLPLDEDGDCLTSPDSFISVCKVSLMKSEEDESRKNGDLLEVEDESKKEGKCGTFAQDLSDIWAHICKLGENDLNNSEWVNAKIVKSEEVKEIGFEVGQAIFEILLNEATFDLLF